MSWKKNVFSYLLWILYAVAVELGLVCLADAFCDSMGWEIRIGTIACALYVVAAGMIVFLVHRFAPKYDGNGGKSHTARIMLEAAAVVTLLALGLVFRIRSAGTEIKGMPYYEAAALVSGGSVPQIAHGAVFFYLQMLRILFFFLGNKFMTAVWAQIVIQLAGMLVLYFAVRRLAGNIAALVTLSFCMFSSYLIQEAVILSPSMLYLFFWALAFFLVSVGAIERRSVGWHFVAGIIIAIVCYLDAAGCLVLLLEAASLFRREESAAAQSGRIRRLLFCLAGVGTGFCGAGLADAQMSGKEFVRVLGAWFRRYQPTDFRLPVTLEVQGMPAEYIVLFCVLTLGVFAFWRSRSKDYMKAWLLLLLVLVTAGCFDVFTEEVPMGLYVYLLLAIMAGVAVEECIRREAATLPIKAMETATVAAASVPEQECNGGAAAAPEKQPAAETVAAPEKQPAAETAVAPDQKPVDEAAAQEQQPPQPKPVQMIENPLPLPKKHVKKKLDYTVEVPEGKDDFDLDVAEGDDFDI